MKHKHDDQSALRFKEYGSLPSWAHSMAAIGSEMESAIYDYFGEHGAINDSFSGYNTVDMDHLAEALSQWQGAPAAALFKQLVEMAKQSIRLNLGAISRWILLHIDDPDSVLDCIAVEPPKEVEVAKVLSRRGSQKLVFEGTWHALQKRVVLKKLLVGNLAHESNAHPLSLSHPNIIETHILQNAKGEAYLVERWLPEVLNDEWPCKGVQQAANLLYNLADAVAFIHSKGLVHGDIKPDNIGKEDDAFILLDFGISRPIDEFTSETTATGSLRTRAPELLLADAYGGDATKIDIWAIGATLFKFVLGRFPLIDQKDEPIPRISEPERRRAFEQELARRVREEWDQRVAIDVPADPLQAIIGKTLVRDPAKRPTAAQIVDMVEKELPVYLRSESASELSPIEELSQLTSYLPSSDVLALMPADEKTRFRNRIAKLREIPGFTQDQLQHLASLDQNLNA